MNDSQLPDITPLVAIVGRWSRRRFQRPINEAAISEFLRDILFGQRNLWGAATLGIITWHEASCAMAARVEDLLMREFAIREYPSTPEQSESVLSEIEAALLRM